MSNENLFLPRGLMAQIEKLRNFEIISAFDGRLSMPKFKIKSLTTVSVLTLAAATLFTSESRAQTAAAPVGSVESVVVTGTLIARSGYTAPTPLTVVSTVDLQAAGAQNVADFVNELPALSGSASPTSSVKGVSGGNAGQNTLNLRNLGSSRTLVLFDGQRSVSSALSGVADVNNFPQSLISRVEVVTGGASATYGSDAVAGVVNFILDKNYKGFKGDYSISQTSYGDDKQWNGYLTFGSSFAGGRGHVLLSAEAADTAGFVSLEKGWNNRPRDWAKQGWKIINNPAYTATNGQPRQLVANHVGIASATYGGIIVSGPLKGTTFGAGGTPTPLNYGLVSGNFMQGGDWQATDVEGNTTMDSALHRQGLFGRASYDLTDDVNVYAQISRTTSDQISVNSFESQFGGLIVSATNPFIPTAVAAQAAALKLTQLEIGTMNGDLPPYRAVNSRTVDRYVLGGSGAFRIFGDTWKWNGYAQSGVANVASGADATRKSLYAKAIQAVRAPNGQIVCASTLINPTDGCVPYNLFGTGVNSEAVVKYLEGSAHMDAKFTEEVAALNLQGEPFSNWAGPVSVAFGASHRGEHVSGTSTDADKARDFYAGNYIPTFGKYYVDEAYLETIIPLAQDLPLIKDLNIDSAVRATNYSTSGYVTTWKISGSYSPVSDLRFRATLSRDIRAPNLGELYTTGTTSASTVVDPFMGGLTYNASTLSTGNPDLKPELGKSTDFGFVYNPSFLPRFNFSVDYFRVEINEAIGSASTGSGKGQNIIDQCYAGQTQYCSALIRGGPVVGGVSKILYVNQTNFNLASQKVDGIDISANYRTPVSNIIHDVGGDLSFRVLATNTFHDRTISGIPGDIPIDSAGTNAGNGPASWRVFSTVAYDHNGLSATLTGRGISAGKYDNNWIECTSGCPTSTAQHITTDRNRIDGAFYLDGNLSYDFKAKGAGLQLYFNVKNIFDLDPPVAAQGPSGTTFTTAGENAVLYDTLGRIYRLGLRFKM